MVSMMVATWGFCFKNSTEWFLESRSASVFSTSGIRQAEIVMLKYVDGEKTKTSQQVHNQWLL